MTEVWKDIDGYEGFYKVSNLGRVMSVAHPELSHRPKTNRIMHFSKDKDGYSLVTLTKRGQKGLSKRVHRLVAQAFIPNPENYKEINHINEIKDDNRVENLEWCTTRYNLTYGHRLDSIRGEKCSKSKLTSEEVEEIRRIYEKGSTEYGQSALGKKYGVSHGSIAYIVKGKSWKHLLTQSE